MEFSLKRRQADKFDLVGVVPVGVLVISLLVAFWLRWQFLQKINLYPDEFVTLLAMKMIQQKGVPILPSGLFYEHGLLYSYLAGLVALLGEPVFWGRMTSLLLGLAAIVLTYLLGTRWFSPLTGLLAAVGLVLAPAAIEWSGRVRMYTLLQVLVLLTLWFMLDGTYRQQLKSSWLAVLAYAGALLTQFVAMILMPPLSVAEIIALQTQPQTKRWYTTWSPWLRGMAIGGAVLVAFLIKRAGQPKGLEPLQTTNALGGLWQVWQIYSSFSLNLGQSWRAIASFFLEPPALIYSLFALIAIGFALRARHFGPTLFLATVLGLSTLEILLFAPVDRRDEKYLFMLLPVLFLLGGEGLRAIIDLVVGRWQPARSALGQLIGFILLAGLLFFYTRDPINDILSDVGEDYEAAFAYVAEQWQPADTVMTGTPTVAYHYLGRNDYYAVEAGGLYDYRILYPADGTPVERWLGSPWIHTLEQLNQVLASGRVWVVLERWGLLIQYYKPFFMQNLLAQTEFVREDNGIIVLKSLPEPKLLQESPTVSAEVLMQGASGDPGFVNLLGYALEGPRLTLYWQVQTPMIFDYTVFVNVQNEAGETVIQLDHPPLGSIYPTTLWPAGEVIRETSLLDLPPGHYQLRVGMYRLETGERLWVPSDQTLQNMGYLGPFEVK